MCPCGVTLRLGTDCCFNMIALYKNLTNHVGPIQSELHVQLIEM